MTRPTFTVRPEVADLTPYSPGLAIDEIREKYGLPQVIKLASNENPLGASPLVVKAIQKAASLSFRYPQSGNPRLVAALAKNLGVDCDRIVVGNGSDEIIDLLIRILASPGTHNIVTCDPCFSIYSLQAKIAGVALRQVPLKRDFSWDWKGLSEQVDHNTAIVFLTSPDNPSGYCPARGMIEEFASSLPSSCLLVMDEAYMDFVDQPQEHSMLPLMNSYPNVAVIRTFSKCYGLAGLRLGYGIMSPYLADYMHRVRLPFSVNILAEEAGIAALQDTEFKQLSVKTVREGREYLTRELRELECIVQPSQSNFLMFSLPPYSGYTAQNVFEALLTRGVIIRPLKSYGLPDQLRVSIGNAQENKVFVTALRRLIGN